MVEPWTGDRPDPARWLATPGLERARREVEDALRAGASPIVISGPTGHGKTLLLRSLRDRPPHGFAPLFVPFANVEPDELAVWILASARLPLDGDPAAGIARLLRASILSGERKLLLVDELQAMPRATLTKLFELIAASNIVVQVVAAGLAGEPLDALLWASPYTPWKIVVADPWSRAEVELVLARVAVALRMSLPDLLAAVDVEAVLRAGFGNPRLVLAALAARLMEGELPWTKSDPVAGLACAQPAEQLGAVAAHSSEILGKPVSVTRPELPAAGRSKQPPVAARSRRPRIFATPMPPPVPAAARRAAVAARRPRRRVASRSAWVRARDGSRSALARANVHGRNLAGALDRFAAEVLGAIVVLFARIHRAWQRGAASLRRAAKALAASIAGVRMDTARRAYFKRMRLEREVRSALAASVRLSRSVRRSALRLGAAAGSRTLATAADLRSRARALTSQCGDSLGRSLDAARLAVARCPTPWNGARNHIRRIGATGASASAALLLLADRALQGVAPLPRVSHARFPILPARYAFAMGGSIAAISALALEVGRVPTPLTGPSGERILFRVNSHPWSTVELDGMEAGATPFTISLEPGLHHFRVAMADGRILEQRLVVSAEQDRVAFR